MSLLTEDTHAEIVKAIKTGTLRSIYQPVLDLQTNKLAGFAVHARWRHEILGHVPPSEFLPVVAQAGMLAECTRHMVTSACNAAVGWPGTFWLGFNIEAIQLGDGGLPELFADAVALTGFSNERVVIEVGQEAFASDHDQACLVLNRLIELGFRLALSEVDGNSGLRPILSVPFSLLKLKRELVRATVQQGNLTRRVKAVLGLAKGLEIPVVATGIETEAQANWLRGLGCELGQGSLFGEALPAALAGDMVVSLKGTVPFPPVSARPDLRARKIAEASCTAFAEMLDGLGVAFCLFDDEDHTVLWNRTFVDFFPEHRHQVFKGEPYRENLRRFYDARLHGEERQNIERYITDGIARHRAQSRPFTFHHRGRRLHVASLAIPEVGRARVWKDESAPHGTITLAKDSWHGDSKLAKRFADGYAALDEAGRVVSINGEFLRLYGADMPEQVLGLTLAEVVRQAWLRHVDDKLEETAEGSEDDFVDNARFAGAPFEVRMPDKQWRRVLEHRDSSGQGHSVHSDITVMKREQQELRATREALRERNIELAMLAGTDGLTGVANRRRFGERLAEMWSHAAANQAYLTLLLIDVDHFKAVNDRFGHPGGDECLRQIAVSIDEIIRSPNDLIARYGGEEFAVILPDTDGAAALVVAERIRQGVARDQSNTFKVTISVGCVSVCPGFDRTARSADMIEQADMALYRAKRNGRNRVEAA